MPRLQQRPPRCLPSYPRACLLTCLQVLRQHLGGSHREVHRPGSRHRGVGQQQHAHRVGFGPVRHPRRLRVARGQQRPQLRRELMPRQCPHRSLSLRPPASNAAGGAAPGLLLRCRAWASRSPRYSRSSRLSPASATRRSRRTATAPWRAVRSGRQEGVRSLCVLFAAAYCPLPCPLPWCGVM